MHPLVQQLTLPLDRLPDPLPIPTLAQAGVARFNATITPPGSKSLTNRALLLALLAEGDTTLNRPLTDADDAKRMLAAIDQLGGRVHTSTPGMSEANPRLPHALRITGTNATLTPPTPHPPPHTPTASTEPVFLNNAGTATRFLAAASVLASGPITIDGNDRMRERPIHQLTQALAQLGVSHTYLNAAGCPPVTLTPPAQLPSGATVTFDTLPSSQFVSGLLLVAPFLPGGLTIAITGEVTSRPYIEMTLALLARVGAHVRTSDDLKLIRVTPPTGREHAPGGRGLDAFTLDIEPDASGATYWHTAAAICPGSSVTVPGLTDSLQGDASYPELLARMGARVSTTDAATTTLGPEQLRPINTSMAPMPDAAMSLAVAAAFASDGAGPTRMTGLETLRVKETDRIAAMQTELTKLGMTIETNAQGDPGAMTFSPPPTGLDHTADAPPVAFDTYDDHRMAMSLALIALRRPNILINDPACVAKTYPGFFQDLARLYT